VTGQPPWRLQWRFIIAVLALAGAWLAMLLGGVGPADRAIYEALYAGHRPALLAIARFFTLLGEPTWLIGASAVIALWLWYAGRARVGLVLVTVTLTGRLLGEAQKYWISRARPDVESHLVVVKTSSFPSGHATSSMIFYLALALLLVGRGRWRFVAPAAAILLSLLIGTSRVMLGVHWPSDVVGGWAFGLLWVLLTLRPAERLLRSNSEMEQSGL
jgi:membrane-associated phospholipid phosphatase